MTAEQASDLGAAGVRGREPELRGEAAGAEPVACAGDAGAEAGGGFRTIDRQAEDRLRSLIRDVPDFPRPGILFKDITPLMADAGALKIAVDGLAAQARPLEVDCVLAAEARGFLLGPALALRLGAGFALARKPGKLPHRTIAAHYELEYGSDSLELHVDALRPGARVLVHDDLLATGGTARALCELVQSSGARVVGCGFLVELCFLGGRERLAPHPAHALLRYDA